MFHKSGVEIWSTDVCNFRRRVVRVWAPMACRTNSQSGKLYPWKPNCLRRDANWWTSSRHGVPVARPRRFTERCWCCTCYRKHGRWRPGYLEELDIIQYFPPMGQLFFWLSLHKIVEATLWAQQRGWGKSMKQEGRGQSTTFERMNSTKAKCKPIKINWVQDKSNSSKP